MIKHLNTTIALISFILSSPSFALTPSLPPTEVFACVQFIQNQPILTARTDKTISNFIKFLEREPEKEFHFGIYSKIYQQYDSSDDLNSYFDDQNLQFQQNIVLLKTIHNYLKSHSTLKNSHFMFTQLSGRSEFNNKCDMEIRINSKAAESLCELTSLSTSNPSFMNTSCLVECDSESCHIK